MENLKVFEVDLNKDNYSQRNNKFVWRNKNAIINASTMCNVTSYIMAADYAGYTFPSGSYTQPEDNFAEFIMSSKKVDSFYKQEYPSLYKDYKEGVKDCYTPNEIHKILSYAFNLWIGKENASTFVEGANLKKELWTQLVNNHLPIIVSGKFPKSNGSFLNHIVVISGIEMKKEFFDSMPWNINLSSKLPEYTRVKIDDPYGNTLEDWKNSGNDVWVDWNYAIKYLKPLNSENKWIHKITNP